MQVEQALEVLVDAADLQEDLVGDLSLNILVDDADDDFEVVAQRVVELLF